MLHSRFPFGMEVHMNEVWKPVVGYEGIYEVSSHGSVRSLDRYDSVNRRRKGRLMCTTRIGMHPITMSTIWSG